METERAVKFFKDNKFVIDEKKLSAILACIENGYPILASGPTGSGKTLFFGLLANFLGGRYEYASLNGSITIHDLTQERIIGKKGTFEERDMVLARWLRAAQVGTSILQLDEVNAAKPETLLALHPIMDIKGELNLPYTNEVLKVNKNAILVMSCNEGDEYAGVNAMNAAFQNRYIKVHFPYISTDEIVTLLTDKTGIPEKEAKAITFCWQKYMSSKDFDQPVVSIRVLERWAELSKTLGLKTAGEFAFAGLISRDEKELAAILEGDFFVNLEQ